MRRLRAAALDPRVASDIVECAAVAARTEDNIDNEDVLLSTLARTTLVNKLDPKRSSAISHESRDSQTGRTSYHQSSKSSSDSGSDI